MGGTIRGDEMNYVLMIVALMGYGPRPDVRFQDFNSKERCEVALAAVRQAWTESKNDWALNKAVCLPK
jgi:hypothetical protein